MSQQRQELGLKNRDGSLSRRAIRMKLGTRMSRRKTTKGRHSHNPSSREQLRREFQRRS